MLKYLHGSTKGSNFALAFGNEPQRWFKKTGITKIFEKKVLEKFAGYKNWL